MVDNASHNPWATAVGSSSGYMAESSSMIQDSITDSDISQPIRHLEYILDRETFMISGDSFEGFTRIWKLLLGGRKQLFDTDVVKVLRSSGLPDETLGHAWQEASQAILLERRADASYNAEIEDTMQWQDFIILLDACCRLSGNDIEYFLKRFPLPSARTIAIRGRRNPFQAKPEVDPFSPIPVSPMSSPDLRQSVHSIATIKSSPSPPPASSYPTSPESSHSWTKKMVDSSAPQHDSALQNTGLLAVPRLTPQNGKTYLEELQESSHADGLKEFNAVYGSSILSDMKPASFVSRRSSVLEIYESDTMPLLPGASRMGVAKRRTDSPDTQNRHSSFDTQSDYSGIEAFEQPRTPRIRRKELDRSSQSSLRGSLQGEVIRKPLSISMSYVNQQSSNRRLSGSVELEAPLCTPATRQIAKSRLLDIQGKDTSASSVEFMKGYLKGLSLSGNKKDQGNRQFSLSTLATALEGAAKEGSLPIIQAFFELGADPNYSSRGSKPTRHRALDFAAISGQSLVVDYLIHRGADCTAVNTALVHAALAGKVEIATRLVVVHHADVDSGVYLKFKNPEYGSMANTGLRSHIEYVNVISAASQITDKAQRLQFLQLLISKNCNLNAETWKVYQLKEMISPKALTAGELEGVQPGFPKIVHDGFGCSPLARFTPLCSASVKLLLQAGATAFTNSRKPTQLILDGFKQRGFPCKSYDVVQPINCITPETWKMYPTECLQTIEALALHGSKLSWGGPNGYEEKHAWRRAVWGAFEEKWAPSTLPLTPLRRAIIAQNQEGVACLRRLGAIV